MNHTTATGTKWGRAGGVIGVICALALPIAASGCTATAGVGTRVVYGYPAYEVEAVPVAIETYPRVYYRDSYAYLVEGRWYYSTPRGWVVFRDEPSELRSYRVQHAGSYRAPPARRTYSPNYGYPRPMPRRR